MPLQPMLFLVYAFVNTFGITQPTPEGARKAARVLGWLLLAVLIVIVGLVALIKLPFRIDR